MRIEDLRTIDILLDELIKVAPCKGEGCTGCLDCEFGEYGAFGESCAIQSVQNALYSVDYDND